MSVSSAQSKKQVKARRRGPNTKAGCNTCKVRRKRCDQARPACRRCSSTGRSCDFLPSHLSVHGNNLMRDFQQPYKSINWLPGMTAALPLLRFDDPVDVNHFDYFRCECTKEFSGFFNAALWQQLIMQAIYSEPFMLHAALAISALRRTQLVERTSDSGADSFTSAEYATRNYTTALKILRQRLCNQTIDSRFAVLATLVFLAIEVLQGHEEEAMVHIRSGKAILKSQTDNFVPISNLQRNSRHNTISDDIVTAFTRLSVEEDMFIGAYSSNSMALPSLPLHFGSISKAQTTLNSIMAATYSFFRRNGNEFLKTLPFSQLPTETLAKFTQIQSTLQDWYTSFNSHRLSNPEASDPRQFLTTKILMVYYHVSSIRLSTYFYYSELIYDQYHPQFQTILVLSSEIIALQNSLPSSEGPCYTLNIAMAQPLFFIARKCRNLALRTRAIGEMKKVGSGGLYTGRNVAKVAEWIVVTEHGLSRDEFVPEKRRLIDVHFDFDRVRMVAVVTATRRVANGGLEALNEDLDLV